MTTHCDYFSKLPICLIQKWMFIWMLSDLPPLRWRVTTRGLSSGKQQNVHKQPELLFVWWLSDKAFWAGARLGSEKPCSHKHGALFWKPNLSPPPVLTQLSSPEHKQVSMSVHPPTPLHPDTLYERQWVWQRQAVGSSHLFVKWAEPIGAGRSSPELLLQGLTKFTLGDIT